MSASARHSVVGATARSLAALGFLSLCLSGCGESAGPAAGEWVDYHLPGPGFRVAIWAAGPDRIWVLGIAGHSYLYLIENGEPRQVPEAQPLIRAAATYEVTLLWGTSDQDIWIDSLGHFDGTTWKQQLPFRPPRSGGALWGFDPQHYYMAAGDWLSVYDGKTWSAGDGSLALDLPLGGGGAAMHGSGPNDIHVVFPFKDAAKLVHFDGKEWLRKDSPVAKALYRAVWVRSPSEAWAVGAQPDPGTTDESAVFVSWNGHEWKLDQPPAPDPLYHVTGCADGRVFAATARTVYERQGSGPWREVFKVKDKYVLEDIHCAGGALMVCEVTVGSTKETVVWVRR